MKKIFMILMLTKATFSYQFLFAQNLVPNWSFEDTLSCPAGGGAIDLAIGWSSYGHSPDYCNSCNTAYQGIPSNQWGYQYPKTGNAYAGFISFINYAPNYREFIGIQLNQFTVIGIRYYISFYVSLGYNLISQRFGIASNKVGINLATVAYTSATPAPIADFALVYSDSIITDTSNWMRISGNFIADSAYNYLIIGNFFHDSLTSIISFDTNATHAYYYVDDIRFSTDSNFVNDITENNNNAFVNLYPNPANEEIILHKNDVEYIKIYDVLGKLILAKHVERCDGGRINTSNFKPGIYILIAKTNTTEIISKILITH